MNIQNIVQSVEYVEFINNLDNLINELLYSANEGYINLSPKEAVMNYQKYMEKFNYETDKILKEAKISNVENIIDDKKQEFRNSIKKHYKAQVHNRTNEVFWDFINNSLLKVSINSQDKIQLDYIRNTILGAINWLAEVESINNEDKNKIISKINSDFSKALNSKDSDYLNKKSPEKSDCKLFLQLRNLLKDDIEKFKTDDLEEYKYRLSSQDINYLQKLKLDIVKNKTAVLDEMNLIDTAIKCLNIKNDVDKYNFIVQINDDKKLIEKNDEQSLMNIVKRRISLFKNSNHYYEKLLGF